jgi:hypothetical protein
MIRKAQWLLPRLMFMVFLIFVIVGCPAYGQELEGRSDPEGPQKKWQLKFSVGADFVPREFDGLKIYLQRSISRNSAVRFGVGLRRLDLDSMSKNSIIEFRREYNEEIDYGDYQMLMGLDLTFIDYIKSETIICPYIGMGPFFDRTIFGYERTYRRYGGRTGEYGQISDYSFIDTGLRTILGVEWRLHSALILQVEYSVTLHYIRYRTDWSYEGAISNPDYFSEYAYSGSHYRIDADNIKTGVSVAF